MGLDHKSLGLITVGLAIFILVVTGTNVNWEMTQDNSCLHTTLTKLYVLFIAQAAMAVVSILMVFCCCQCIEIGYQFWLCMCNCVLSVLFIVPIIWMFVDCEVPIMGKNVFHLLVNLIIVVVGAAGLIAAKFVRVD